MQKKAELRSIVVTKEDLLLMVSSLRYVIKSTEYMFAWWPWHNGPIIQKVRVVKYRFLTSRFFGVVGVDGVTKQEYGENLEANLEDLISRMKRMAYQPGAVREALIDKEGQPGAKRPLGISNFEDKLVQKRMQELLDAIYDPIFIEHSYGFRPKRG